MMKTAKFLPFLLTFILFGYCYSAFAENLTSVHHAGLNVALDKVNNEYNLTVERKKKGSSPLTVDAFSLANPTRLVIDIIGHRSPKSADYPLKKDVISGVRFGVHKDKTRIVIDIDKTQEPYFNINKLSGDKINVSFNFDTLSIPTTPTAEIPTTIPVEEPKKIAKIIKEPTKEPVKNNTAPIIKYPTVKAPAVVEQPIVKPRVEEPEPVKIEPVEVMPVEPPVTKPKPYVVEKPKEKENIKIAKKTTPIPKKVIPIEPIPQIEEPKVPPTPQTVETPPYAPKTAIVDKISFQRVSKSKTPAIVVAVNNLDTYTFLQKRPQAYSLTLENTRATDTHVMLTQFPPEDFNGIEAVTAYKKGNNLVVKIYVEKGIKLLPYRLENELWVKVVN